MVTVRRLATLALLAGPLACSADRGAGDAGELRDARRGARDAGGARVRDATTPDERDGRATANGETGPQADAQVRRDAGHDARSGLDARADASDSGNASPDAAFTIPTATTLALSLPLVPAFSTSIHDYYVACTAAENPIVVTMTAAPGSTIALLQPITTPPGVNVTVEVNVAAGAAIVAGVTQGGGGRTAEYWVRCLPPDFPDITFTLHPDAGTPTPGYYLLSNVFADGPGASYAIILDSDGVPVWYETVQPQSGVVDVEHLLPDTISFGLTGVGGDGGLFSYFELDDLASHTTTKVTTAGTPVDLHELRVLPNGDYLVFTVPFVTGVDLTGLEMFGPDESILSCEILELAPSGAVVWQWDVTDHFDAVKDSTYPEIASMLMGTIVDPFHCNSIDVDAHGDLLVSARNMDSIFLVSRATGAVIWKMGGATYTKDDALYIAVENDPLGSFHRQHDARLQPDGTISMFDDETALPGPARAVVYSYDLTSATATPVWQYSSAYASAEMGSFRISADGSCVIGWGFVGIANLIPPAFSEVTESGQDLLDVVFPDGNATYRAVKVPTTAFPIAVLRAGVASGG